MSVDHDRYNNEGAEELSDLFEERARAKAKAEAAYELEHARKKAEQRADDSTIRSQMRMTHTQEKRPDIEEFSETERFSMERLKPQVKLTSMEEDEMRKTGQKQSPERETNRPVKEGGKRTEKRPPVKEQTEYRRDIDYDYDEEDDTLYYEDEPEEEKGGKGLIIGIISGIIVLLLIAIALVLAFGGKKGGEQSSTLKDLKEVTGVVTSIDADNESMLIYSAETKQEMNFSSFGTKVTGLKSYQDGDIVVVSYDASNGNEVDSIKEASGVTVLKNISGVKLAESTVSIDGKVYQFDDHLVCEYDGKAFDRRSINEDTEFTAYAIKDHIYTIRVKKTTINSTLIVENLSGYVGKNAQIVVTPYQEGSSPIEMSVTSDTMKFSVPEGTMNVQIKMKKNDAFETIYSQDIFVASGDTATITVPAFSEQTGTVVFVSESKVPFTATVKEQQIANDTETELPYGSYTATVSADGYDDQTVSFTVSQPFQQVSVRFNKKTAKVTVSASLDSVSLYVDSVYQGEIYSNSSLSLQLGSGSHTLTCSKTGYYDQSQTINIGSDMSDQMIYFSEFTPIEESSEESSAPEESSQQSTPESSSEESSESSETSESSVAPENSSASTGE